MLLFARDDHPVHAAVVVVVVAVAVVVLVLLVVVVGWWRRAGTCASSAATCAHVLSEPAFRLHCSRDLLNHHAPGGSVRGYWKWLPHPGESTAHGGLLYHGRKVIF